MAFPSLSLSRLDSRDSRREIGFLSFTDLACAALRARVKRSKSRQIVANEAAPSAAAHVYLFVGIDRSTASRPGRNAVSKARRIIGERSGGRCHSCRVR